MHDEQLDTLKDIYRLYKALVDILKQTSTLFLGNIYKVPWVFFGLIGYLYLNISVVELLGYQSLLKWYLISRDICNYRHTCICMYCIIIIFYWYLCSNEILFFDEHPNSDIFSKEYIRMPIINTIHDHLFSTDICVSGISVYLLSNTSAISASGTLGKSSLRIQRLFPFEGSCLQKENDIQLRSDMIYKIM